MNLFFKCLVKRFIVLSSLLLLSFQLHAAVSWEFELKGNAGMQFLNEELLYDSQNYKDFVVGFGLDTTLCFGRYVGLEISAGYYPLCYPSPKTSKNDWIFDTQNFAPSLGAGIAIMIPFTESLKLKTSAGIGGINYPRYEYMREASRYGEFEKATDWASPAGITSSLSCIWMPLKHFGLSLGSDFIFCNAEGRERELPYSRYKYKPKYKGFLATSYVGAVIKLGKSR
jgi:hypothetical protein